ncbi:MAG TPA: hypothetical protein VME22_23640 [Solirubrobacteraceae bacterium]|nr:hypothetical protein [Solirubrobacteraceae bacterium]
MSSVGADLEHARAVKDQLAECLRGEPAVNGIGVTRHHGGWAVKVNLVRPAPQLRLPKQIDGVEIQTDLIGPIVAQ